MRLGIRARAPILRDMYDETDLKILQILQENARTPNAEVARRVGLAPSAVFQRIRKLEDQGVITGYHAQLCPIALDQGLLAFVLIRTSEGARARETAAMLSAIPEVLEVHRVVGDDCFFLKVRVRDTDALGALLDEKIQPLPPVASTRTTIVLTTAKDTDPPVQIVLDRLRSTEDSSDNRAAQAS